MKFITHRFLVIALLLVSTYAHAQSKKEQIETLTFRVDSLNRELNNQATANNARVAELNATIAGQEKQISALNEQLKRESDASNRTISELNTSIATSEKQINSLKEQLKSESETSAKKVAELNSALSDNEKQINKLKDQLNAIRDSSYEMETLLGAKELYILKLTEENAELKSQLASNASSAKSESNLDVGTLLTCTVEPGDGSDELYDFFYNKNTIKLPFPEDVTNFSNEDIIPFGWNTDGVFAYYSVPFNACGLCSATLQVLDIKTNKILFKQEYNLQGSEDSELDVSSLASKLKTDKSTTLSKYSLTPVNKLSMHFKLLDAPTATLNNVSIELMKQNGKALLYQTKGTSPKSALYELKLGKIFSEILSEWCEEDAIINGYFVNPLNEKQIVIQLLHAVPCGYEMETDYKSIFVAVNL